MTTSLPALRDWVQSVAAITLPENVHWCDGSDSEYKMLIQMMTKSGSLIELNQKEYPDCYLHRSDPSDVARVEHLTFICTKKQEDAGPNNHWMSPEKGHKKIDNLFKPFLYFAEILKKASTRFKLFNDLM